MSASSTESEVLKILETSKPARQCLLVLNSTVDDSIKTKFLNVFFYVQESLSTNESLAMKFSLDNMLAVLECLILKVSGRMSLASLYIIFP